MPKVSVLIPVYNGMPYLEQAVASVLGQTLQDIELLVLNDASTDGTAACLDRVRDDRLRVFHCPKQGHASLLNLGLKEARSKYAARLDADDVALPERLEKQWEFMEQNPDVAVCGCQMNLIDPEGVITEGRSFPASDVLCKHRLLRRCPFCHPGVIYRVSDVLAVGGYIPPLVPAEDYDLWWRMASRGRFANLPQVLLHYRVHANSVSATREAEVQRAVQELRVQHLLRAGFAASQQEALDFTRCHISIYTGDMSQLTAEQCESFLRVMERFLQWASQSNQADQRDVAIIRREIRWAFLRQSARLTYFSRDRLYWLNLARRIDPEAMKWNRAAARALGQAWAGLLRKRQTAPEVSTGVYP